MQQKLTGTAAAGAIKRGVLSEVAMLKNYAIEPMLAILRVGERDDDKAYEQSLLRRCAQAGIGVRSLVLNEHCDTSACIKAIETLNGDDRVHGVLMMRPLPKHLDEPEIIRTLDVLKDVDGMTPLSLASVFMGQGDGFAPCTAEAVVRLLLFEGVELSGRETAIIGRSLVVGKPLSMLLLKENATVTVCHTRTKSLSAICRRADILIAAAGQRGMVDASFVKPGAILIDVGIHTDENGNLCGDISSDATQNAQAYTPVPGGVGSVTGWLMMEHVVKAAKRAGGLK